MIRRISLVKGLVVLVVVHIPSILSATQPSTHLVAWGDHGTNVPAGLTNVVAISSGLYINLALRYDGTVIGWGTTSPGSYTPPTGLSNVVAINAGYQHSLAVSNGLVIGWGENFEGELSMPPGLTNAVEVDSGWHTSAALRSDGTVLVWGTANHNQTNVPPGLSNVVAISIQYSSCLALRSDGTVVAWGQYFDGDDYAPAFTPPGLSNVISIAGGWGHLLAAHADGSVTAWGANFLGQTNVPAGLSDVVKVAAPGDGDHCLALRGDGTVVGWGAITPPSGLSNVVSIAGGGGDGIEDGLALVADGPFFTSPRLDIGASNGSIQISIEGEAHRRYVLESATTLGSAANWTFVRNARLANAYQTVHQFTATHTDTRFYRVRQLH